MLGKAWLRSGVSTACREAVAPRNSQARRVAGAGSRAEDPDQGHRVGVYALTAAFAALAEVGNLLTGGNYMFLREKPSRASVLDLMGPWP